MFSREQTAFRHRSKSSLALPCRGFARLPVRGGRPGIGEWIELPSKSIEAEKVPLLESADAAESLAACLEVWSDVGPIAICRPAQDFEGGGCGLRVVYRACLSG